MLAIPGRLVRFLDQFANLAYAGTRDRNRVPRGHRVSGWRRGADGRTLTAIVATGFTSGLVESVEDNGRFALTVEEYPSHETYQFKGRYLRHRPLDAQDVEAVDRIRERFVRNVLPFFPGAPPNPLQSFILAPELAVEFEVHEIYLQTPGPGAGARLVPPAEQ
jgi:hypothetical protein